MCNYCHFSEPRQHSNLVKYCVGICQCLGARTQWSTNLEQGAEGTAKVWLAHGTTCFSFCSRALAIFYTFLEHSVLRTILYSKIDTQNIIQGFCFYLEDKAKKLTSWLQDAHSSGVVNGSCRNLVSLKSQALTTRKKFTAGRSWPTGKFEAWIRKRTIQPCFDCMQTGNTGISRLLPKSSVPKMYMILFFISFCKGRGYCRNCKIGQLPKENEDCFVREYSARLRNS